MKKLIFICFYLVISDMVGAQTLSELIIAEINFFRAEKSLAPLGTSECLDRAAQHHANWMAEARSGGHTEFRRIGQIIPLAEPSDRFAKFGCRGFGENVLRWYPAGESHAKTAKGVVQAWIDSPAHYELILCPQINDQVQLGIGISQWVDRSGASYCLTLGLK